MTGGGSGIGEAVGRALVAEGAFVGLMARSRSACERIADELGRDRALPLSADVTDVAACEEAILALESRFGETSIVVNAAGISPIRRPAEQHDADTFASILRVNALGAHNVTRAAARSLQARGGAVVNVSSALGLIASPMLAGYGASKAALVHLTRTLAREWAQHGVRVNAVCPGYLETPLTASMLAVDRLRDEVLAQTPLGRLASLAEVVAPILFLLSDDASYVTGAALSIDGGMTA